EHEHTPDCLIEEVTLICALEEDPGHAHNETCYKQIKGDLICTSEEYEGHSHGDSCYATVTEQVPKTVEITVEIPCAVTDEGHVCDDSCITTEVTTGIEYEEKTVEKLVCEIPEDPGHAHDDTCYAWTPELICTLEERPPVHIHEDACYKTEEVLVCGKDAVEVHEHDLDCYGDIELEDGTVLVFAEAYEAAQAAWTGEGDYVFDPIEWADYLKCGKPEVREHIHGETCFEWPEEGATVEVNLCGKEEHTHDEILCYPAQDVYYCGLPEHSHNDSCPVDENGELICALEAHTHDEGCSTAVDTPEAEAAALMAMIDALPDIETVEAELLAYEEAEDWEGYAAYTETFTPAVYEAYDIYMAMDAETQALVTNSDRLLDLLACCTPRTLEEPVAEDIVHPEGDVAGTYYHSGKYKYYEIARHGLIQSDIMTFPLIPADEYSEDWAPNTTQWSAKTDANYLTAYCAECMVTVSSSGAEYDSFTIDNSRFASTELRKQLAGIIAHSYPFLTYEEMQAELAAAYANGEIQIDPAECSESEYMAATQAAIWQLTMPGMQFNSFYVIDTDNLSDEETAEWQGLIDLTIHKETKVGHKTEYSDHCLAIRNWLMKQVVPDDLAVASYDYTVEQQDYELYKLTVEADFNRPIIAGEVVTLQLVAGTQETEETTLAAGTEAFTLELSGLTEEELIEAEVALQINGKRMQAYYFEHPSYQDMIAGQWEYYDNDLSFRVTKDSTSVSVTKHWTEDLVDESTEVEVSLFADGTKVRETAVLSAENDWSYSWLGLNKFNSLGEPITYTVQEKPISGYYSTVVETEGENATVQVWTQVDAFEADGQYMLVSDTGGFAAVKVDGIYKPTWTAAHPEDVSACAPNLIWTAQEAAENKFYLYNNSLDAALGFYGELTEKGTTYYYRYRPQTQEAQATWAAFSFTDGYLHTDYNEHTDLDFCYIGTNNSVVTANFRSNTPYATPFTLYKLTEIETPPAEHNFIVTNTKIREDIDQVNVSIAKQWAGRPDNTYPKAVSVQLLQNDRAYDVPMTLDADSGWSYTWSGLPETDNDGDPFDYTVAEVDVPAGYEAEITANAETTADAEKTYSFTVTNTWTPDIEIEVHKADEGQRNVLLAGAEFDLYLQSDNGEGKVPIPGSDTANGYKLNTEPLVTNADGELKLKVAAGETYYLVETKAPAGFNLLGESIGFTAAKHGTKVTITLLGNPDMAEATEGTLAILTVYNDSGFELPETGFAGWGAEIYQMGGAAVSAAAAIGLLYKKRRTKGGQDPS
ncbi:MAG: Cna B-type domain-containing protein, partial [Clostridia bacterium]|nr:Cna B-type domain-containing protein [Clostridia bacterium]